MGVNFMKREDLWQLRQSKGDSMDMVAGFLGKTLEEYAEMEFGLRQPDDEELIILRELFGKQNQIIVI